MKFSRCIPALKVSAILGFLTLSCAHQSVSQTVRTPASEAPVVEKQPLTLEKFGDVRVDNYFWLREKTNPKVIDHLNAENTYVEEQMRSTEGLREQLFQEMKSRMKENDTSTPIQRKDYFYYLRTEAGKQHAIHARRKAAMTAQEEIILDENELAKDSPGMQCSGPMMSPSQNLMAFACDFKGNRLYEIKVKDLKSGKLLPVSVKDVGSRIVWANNNRHFFYVKPDPKTLRSRWVYRYDLQTGKSTPIFDEKDETYNAFISSSMARKLLFIGSFNTLATEYRTLSLDQPTQAPKLFLAREKDHRYFLEDGGDRLFVMTNWQAKNNRIMETTLAKNKKENWKEITPARGNVYVSDVSAFRNHLVYVEKEMGQDQGVVLNRDLKSPARKIPLRDASVMFSLTSNVEYDAPFVRYVYQSFRQPLTTIDVQLSDLSESVRKVREVPGYNPDLYRTEKVWITVRDGTKVPVDLLMKKDQRRNGSAPMLVYSYGAYGMEMTADFSPLQISLIDRGWVYALPHIRGGRDLGEDWYIQGRTDKKMNTFYDFIDTTEGLIKQGFADKKRVYARGGSAGGLLVGATMNLRPDLYRGIVAEVPFVDVINTMLDSSLPLTTGEYSEWGNPNVEADYKYIRQYSPYDNVKAGPMPHIFATAGLNDSQVPYWEAAKWIAKIRELKTNNNLTLLKTEMSTGHGGASGRYDSLKDEAWVYAFLLTVDK